MEFRPCIDIHNGKVKQIVGGTLTDAGDRARENFVSAQNSAFYANMYKELGIKGGHVIMLNGSDSPYFEATKKEALSALSEYRGGLQIGGGINDTNAAEYIEAGASHVIVTSFVFADGVFHEDRLKSLSKAVGREHVVVDLSCRMRGGKYYVVTDRWQKYSDVEFCPELFDRLSEYCDEFLVHAVSVEGTGLGIDRAVLGIMGKAPYKSTYAGGISAVEDIMEIKKFGNNGVNFTVGSCLDIFGGSLSLKEVLACTQ